MRVGVFCNRETKKFNVVREKLFAALRKKSIAYNVYEDVGFLDNEDVLIVLGGDGTILKAAIEAGKRGIPLLGINAGNLGFLTEYEGNQAEEAVSLLLERYETESRSVLEVRAGDLVAYALNDVVFQRGYDAAADDNVVAVYAEINGKKVDRFIGDGLIVSTPTGSTAYSLSAGGSILTPDIAAFILTPVCAHSLHNRPIVYADSSVLNVKFADEGGALSLFCDGKLTKTLHRSEEVTVRKASFPVVFIKKRDSNFFDKLLIKLNKWSK